MVCKDNCVNNFLPNILITLSIFLFWEKSKAQLAEINEILENSEPFHEYGLKGDIYSIIPCDISNVELFASQCAELELNFELPTLLLSECVFIYIDPNHTNKLMKWCKYFNFAYYLF